MPLHLTTKDQFASKEAVLVGTNQMVITLGDALATSNASNCPIIPFHVDGVGGGLAHIPPGDEKFPALEKMLDALMKRGAKANAVEVLIGGEVGRENTPNWRQNFMTKLPRLGLQFGNVIDARTSRDRYPKIVIGDREATGLRVIAYDPKSSQALPLGEHEIPQSKGKSSSVKVYTIADQTGAISPTGREGACAIL